MSSHFSYKTAFVGDVKSGKTSLVSKICGYKPSNFYVPTINANFCQKQINETDEVLIWDTSGDETYRSLIPLYFLSANCVFLFYDVTSRRTFSEYLNSWLEYFAYYEFPTERIRIICSKIDQPNWTTLRDDLIRICSERSLTVFFVSVMANQNVDEINDFIYNEYRRASAQR